MGEYSTFVLRNRPRGSLLGLRNGGEGKDILHSNGEFRAKGTRTTQHTAPSDPQRRLGEHGLLPRTLVSPLGVMNLLHLMPIGFEAFLVNETALRAFQGFMARLLVSGVLGLGRVRSFRQRRYVIGGRFSRVFVFLPRWDCFPCMYRPCYRSHGVIVEPMLGFTPAAPSTDPIRLPDQPVLVLAAGVSTVPQPVAGAVPPSGIRPGDTPRRLGRVPPGGRAALTGRRSVGSLGRGDLHPGCAIDYLDSKGVARAYLSAAKDFRSWPCC